MADDVKLKYKNSLIGSLDASGTKTLLTSGKYCEDNIEVEYTKPPSGRIIQDENGYVHLSDDGTLVAEVPLSVTSNGTYTPNSGYAYSSVNVNVQLTLGTATATPSYQTQEITPGQGEYGLSKVTVNPIAAPDNDVCFYDFLGNRLFSYSFDEISAMSSDSDLPVAPNSADYYINFTKWNWTLAEIKAHKGYVNVGALYEPTDCDAWFLIDIWAKDLRSVTISFIPGSGNTIEVDWGDGSTSTATSSTSNVTLTHEYAALGKYRMKMMRTAGSNQFTVGGWANANAFISGGTARASSVLRQAVVGSKVAFSQVGFRLCPVEVIVVGENTKYGIGINTFGVTQVFPVACRIASRNTNTGTSGGNLPAPFAYQHKGLTIPAGNSSPYQFSQANACREVMSDKLTLPDGVTTLGARCFMSCMLLQSLHIPSSVTTISTSALSIDEDTCACKEIWFYGSPPTLSASNSIIMYSYPNIFVPYAHLAAYLTWTNQPDKTVYTYIGHYDSQNGETLPLIDLTSAYNLTWYGSKEDALRGSNPILTGNGKKVFCTWEAV